MVCVSAIIAVHGEVQATQELDRVEILMAPVLVRDPLALLARIVEVQHRGHRVHPQPVDVIAVEPEQRAAAEEVADFRAAIVEDRAVPFRVEALPRVLVLIEVSAIEEREPMLVTRKVRGHPVEDHADATLVQVIDEIHEVLRRAIA